MADCVFCAIVAGEAPAHILFEDDATMAFLDIGPAAEGHTLVVPKVHRADLLDVSAEEFAAVSRTVHRIAELIDRRLAPDGLTLFQANRPAGWQTVFHFHVHVVPRTVDDALEPPWTHQVAASEHLEAVHERLVGSDDGPGPRR